MIELNHKLRNILMAATVVFMQVACKKDKNESPVVMPAQAGNPQVAVAEKNQALLIKFSGTKCGPCGEWGWQAMEEWIAQNKEKSAYITAYSKNFVAEGLISATATAMDKHWGIQLIQGYPSFMQNGKIVQAADESAWRQKSYDKIAAFANGPVMAAAAFTRKWTDAHTLQVKSSVKFFSEGAGSYYLAIYLTEDSAMWTQSGNPQSNDTIAIPHHHVLRDQINSTLWYGKPLFNGTIKAGAFFDDVISYEVPAAWNNNRLELTAVIWRLQDGEVEFVNAFSDQHP